MKKFTPLILAALTLVACNGANGTPTEPAQPPTTVNETTTHTATPAPATGSTAPTSAPYTTYSYPNGQEITGNIPHEMIQEGCYMAFGRDCTPDERKEIERITLELQEEIATDLYGNPQNP